MWSEGSASTPRLRGRENEMRSIIERLDRATDGSGSAILLRGEPGIGKTRLAQELAQLARERGFAILRGTADELERHRPFATISAAMGLPDTDDPKLQRVSALLHGEMFRGAGVSQSPELQYAVIDLLVEHLEDSTAHRPAMLHVDDLQWTDPSTVMVLRRLVRCCTDLQLLVVGGMRPAPRRPELDMVRAECLEHDGLAIDLGPLTREAVAEIASEVAGEAAAPGLLADIGDGGGNPLFVLELVEGYLAEPEPPERATDRLEPAVPESLRDAVRRRLRRLSDEAMTALRLGAVFGPRFSIIGLKPILGASSAELFSSLEECVAAGVIAEDGDEFAFRHDVIRDVIYDDISASLRRSMHRDVARDLVQRASPVERVAEHFALSAAPGDREAIDWLRRAARRASETAPVAAIELLEAAERLVPSGAVERAEILAEEVMPLLWVSDARRSEAVAREAIAGLSHDPSLQATTRMRLATVLSFTGGKPREVADQLELALPHLEAPARIVARADLARALVRAVDPRAVDELEAVLAEGEASGHDYAVCTSLSMLAGNAVLQEDVERAVDLGARAFERGLNSADRLARLRSGWFEYVMALLSADRFTEARDALERARLVFEQDYSPWTMGLHHLAVALVLQESAWDDALTEAQTAIDICTETQTHHATGLAWGLIAMIRARRGDAPGAVAAADAARSFGVPDYAYAALASALVLVGDEEERFVRAKDAIRWMRETGVRHLIRRLAPEFVRLSLSQGDPELAASVREMLEGTVRDDSPPSVLGAALVCRGLVSGDAKAILAGASELRRAERSFELANAYEDAGRLLTDVDPEGAKAPLTEAADIYERFECPMHLQRVTAMLRSIGVHRMRKTKPVRTADGAVRITPTEAQVLALVREGLTNPQIGERMFISRRTVATHITHLFQKLAVSSRTALAVVSVDHLSDV